MLNHTALAPAGPYADRLADLFWLFTWIAAAVYVIVIGVLLYALYRRRAAPERPATGPMTSATTLRIIASAVAATAVILVVLAASDFFSNRFINRDTPGALRVRITAHQWWWEIEYLDDDPSRLLRTANALRIPTGRPVSLELRTVDVIHSFWVPSLQGKKDLLPGYTTTLHLRATRPGRYTGECAEFCGNQHAHMSLDVEALEPARFAAWQAAERSDAVDASTEPAIRGRELFLTGPCAACHRISGTEARGTVGPDLTHIASRPRIAAGALPNNRGALAAWIAHPQGVKPGCKMPDMPLSGPDLRALVDYLETLR